MDHADGEEDILFLNYTNNRVFLYIIPWKLKRMELQDIIYKFSKTPLDESISRGEVAN